MSANVTRSGKGWGATKMSNESCLLAWSLMPRSHLHVKPFRKSHAILLCCCCCCCKWNVTWLSIPWQLRNLHGNTRPYMALTRSLPRRPRNGHVDPYDEVPRRFHNCQEYARSSHFRKTDLHVRGSYETNGPEGERAAYTYTGWPPKNTEQSIFRTLLWSTIILFHLAD